MKRFKVIISVMMAAFALCCLFAACNEDDGAVEPVIITQATKVLSTKIKRFWII